MIQARGKQTIVTIYQIVKLFEHFKRSPSGLMLIPPTSQKEQALLDDIYD